jgi:DNA-directed RNA polymerase I, II, and III subunit RPABC4
MIDMSSYIQHDQAPAVPVSYLCGDCGVRVDIRPADAIRCRDCGCRILYKLRSRNKPMVYEAR